LFLHEHLAQGLVRVGRAEEDAVGHDDGGASAGFEQAEKEGQEEQLGLLGLDDLKEVLRAGLVIERARERRIGQEQGVFLLLAGVVLGERGRRGRPGGRALLRAIVVAIDCRNGCVMVCAVNAIHIKQVPEELRARMETSAARNFRSLNQEALARIELSFRIEDAAQTKEHQRWIDEAMAGTFRPGTVSRIREICSAARAAVK
jgi:hypothetical protein